MAAEPRAHGIEGKAHPGQVGARAVGARRRPGADAVVDGRPGSAAGRSRSRSPIATRSACSPGGPRSPARTAASRSSSPRAASAPRSGSPPSTRAPIRARRSPRSRACSMSSDLPSDGPSAPPERPARARPDLDLASLLRLRGAPLLDALDRHLPGARDHAEATASYAFAAAVGLGFDRAQCEVAREVAVLHEIGLDLRRRRARREAGRRAQIRGAGRPGPSTTRPATGSRAAPGSPSTSAAGCCARASATTAAGRSG